MPCREPWIWRRSRRLLGSLLTHTVPRGASIDAPEAGSLQAERLPARAHLGHEVAQRRIRRVALPVDPLASGPRAQATHDSERVDGDRPRAARTTPISRQSRGSVASAAVQSCVSRPALAAMLGVYARGTLA